MERIGSMVHLALLKTKEFYYAMDGQQGHEFLRS